MPSCNILYYIILYYIILYYIILYYIILYYIILYYIILYYIILYYIILYYIILYYIILYYIILYYIILYYIILYYLKHPSSKARSLWFSRSCVSSLQGKLEMVPIFRVLLLGFHNVLVLGTYYFQCIYIYILKIINPKCHK